jgi:hypothetical protein
MTAKGSIDDQLIENHHFRESQTVSPAILSRQKD